MQEIHRIATYAHERPRVEGESAQARAFLAAEALAAGAALDVAILACAAGTRSNPGRQQNFGLLSCAHVP